MSSSSRDGQQANEQSANDRSKQGIHASESHDQGIALYETDSTPAEFSESGFVENETSTPRVDYQDVVMYPQPNNVDQAPAGDNLFADADADASTIAHTGSFYEGSNNQPGAEAEGFDSQHNTRLYDAAYEAVAINEAVLVAVGNNHDVPFHSEEQICPATPSLRPLELWKATSHRHELIAYRFEQPPHIVQSRNSRQQRR